MHFSLESSVVIERAYRDRNSDARFAPPPEEQEINMNAIMPRALRH